MWTSLPNLYKHIKCTQTHMQGKCFIFQIPLLTNEIFMFVKCTFILVKKFYVKSNFKEGIFPSIRLEHDNYVKVSKWIVDTFMIITLTLSFYTPTSSINMINWYNKIIIFKKRNEKAFIYWTDKILTGRMPYVGNSLFEYTNWYSITFP